MVPPSVVAGAVDRFFLALIPPEPLASQVTALKTQMQAQYQTHAALRSPPHITLQPPFQWPVDRWQDFTTTLQTLARVQTPVTVDLYGFGAFPPRVIFVHVVPSPGLMALQGAIATTLETQLALRPDLRPYHPHMTIAFRDLSGAAFRQAWPQFQTRPFAAQFTATALSLLRHTGQRWQVHHTYPLNDIGKGSLHAAKVENAGDQ